MVVLAMMMVLAGAMTNPQPVSAGSGDNYPEPWRSKPIDFYVDNWGYYSRNCTSWVAWALHDRNGFTMPRAGHATNWGVWAQNNGYAVNDTPAVGAVAWWTAYAKDNTWNVGQFGHIAWVSAVNGNTVTVEEYNISGSGAYRKRDMAASNAKYIHFKDINSGSGGGFGGVGNATYRGSTLTPGQQMEANQYILSDDGRFVLMMQGDGNLVIYGPGRRAYWASNTGGNSGAFLAVQGDGNIVIYTSAYRPIWASHTYGKGTQRLVMQGDGNLVAYTPADNPIWASHSSQAGPYPIYKGGDQIQAGQVLNPNEYLRSGNQLRFAVMQDDGNLVLYEPGYMPYWASNTGGNSGAFLAVQGDGNIVIYTSAYRPIWASHTYGKGTQRLVMQGDGNLVAYTPGELAVWASNTVR